MSEKTITPEIRELVEAMVEAKWRYLVGGHQSWKEHAADLPGGDYRSFWAQYKALQAIEETGKWRVVPVEAKETPQ